MKDFAQWEGFEGSRWKEQINVRDFIRHNYTPYDGDDSFLEGPTEATEMCIRDREKAVPCIRNWNGRDRYSPSDNRTI